MKGWTIHACLMLFATVLLGACVPLTVGLPAGGQQPLPGGSQGPPLVEASPSPQAIFNRIAPSVAFIEVPGGSGSGLLLQNGHVVTNAHVVYPFERARVVFPNGTELAAAPVVAMDLLRDLALIGPLDVAGPGQDLHDGETMPVGSPIYLIGYPAEVEDFPQPTLAGGLLSRFRQWPEVGLTYLQSDATIAGGQSGGVMVSQEGNVVGISGLRFGDQDTFALAASAVDLQLRIDEMLAGVDVDGLGQRMLVGEDGAREHQLTLQNRWDQQAFILQEEPTTDVQVEASSDADIVLSLWTAQGYLVQSVDDTASGVETSEIRTYEEGPHVLVVRQLGEGPAPVDVHSSHDLSSWKDPDDGLNLKIGETVTASLDYPGDQDYYLLALDTGQVVEIRTNALPDVKAKFTIEPLVAGSFLPAYSTFDGGGLYGEDPHLVYQAPQAGTYAIAVDGTWIDDYGGYGSYGGYLLSVSEPSPDAVPVTLEDLTEGTQKPEIVDSPWGPMKEFASPFLPYRVQVPADWFEVEPEYREYAEVAAFASETGGRLGLSEDDLLPAGLANVTLDQYVSLLLSRLEWQVEGFQLRSRQPIATNQGLEGQLLRYTGAAGLINYVTYVYLDDSGWALRITASAAGERFPEILPMVKYLFGTHAVDGVGDQP